MAISDGIGSYLKALERQKSLIAELGSNSGVKIPGLNVDSVIENLAKLNADLQQTYDYYDSQINVEASKEEQSAAEAGTIETEAQKKARIDSKKQEAQKKKEETFNRYKESLGDFVQEQISIIETSIASIEEGTKTLPEKIAVAVSTAALPASLPPGVPNPIYNIGVLYQQIKSIKVVLDDLFSRYLTMLIAADKIKFALPGKIIQLLEKLTVLQDKISVVDIKIPGT